MIDINIRSAAGDENTISADENSTIQNIKVLYAISQGAGLDENDFEFISGTQILDNNTKLNKLLEDVIEGELTITSIRRLPLRAACFREINRIDSSNQTPVEIRQRLSAILKKNISEDGENPILASSDIKIVLAAVQKNGVALSFASEELRNDREIVLAAVNQNGFALRYASEGLRNDYHFMLAAVQQNGFALAFASEDLTANKDIVLAAVDQNGFALMYASEGLRNDYDFMLAAVQKNGEALAFASKLLRNDKELVLAAVQQKGEALQYASEKLRNDSQILQIINPIPFDALTKPSNENTGARASTSSGSRQPKSIGKSQSPRI